MIKTILVAATGTQSDAASFAAALAIARPCAAHLDMLHVRLDAIGVIGALEHVLVKVAPSHHIELGAGVRAVQEVFAGQFAEVASV